MATSPSSIPTIPWLGMTAENYSSGDTLLPLNWKKEDSGERKVAETGKENVRGRLKSEM